jgi:hypothetical protein
MGKPVVEHAIRWLRIASAWTPISTPFRPLVTEALVRLQQEQNTDVEPQQRLDPASARPLELVQNLFSYLNYYHALWLPRASKVCNKVLIDTEPHVATLVIWNKIGMKDFSTALERIKFPRKIIVNHLDQDHSSLLMRAWPHNKFLRSNAFICPDGSTCQSSCGSPPLTSKAIISTIQENLVSIWIWSARLHATARI